MRSRAFQEEDERDLKIAAMNRSRMMSRSNSIKRDADLEKSLINKLELLGVDQMHRSGTLNELKSKLDLSIYDNSLESSRKSKY